MRKLELRQRNSFSEYLFEIFGIVSLQCRYILVYKMAGRPAAGRNTCEQEDKMAALTLMVQDLQVSYYL
jgi:hypothetical protein